MFPQASLQVIAEDACQLWWAGRELQRGKKLQEFVGKNEKTKLVVKISKVRFVVSLGGDLWNTSGCLELTVESHLCFSPERTGGASERAPDH